METFISHLKLAENVGSNRIINKPHKVSSGFTKNKNKIFHTTCYLQLKR